MIKLRGVSYTYPNGIKALNNIDLEIEHGEKVFIAGRTGCGKSTLLRIFNGLIPYFYGGELSGDISIYSTRSPKELVKRVYFVSQHPDEQIVCSHVKHEIAFSLLQRGFNWGDAVEIVREVSKSLGIEHLLSRRTHELSDGEKQMVVIACAIATPSDCIVLDEPFSHLHPLIARDFLRCLLKEERTVVMSEHRTEFLKYFDSVFSLGEYNELSEMEKVEENLKLRAKRDVEKKGDLKNRNVVVKADSITFSYGDNVLFEDLSFELFKGGVYAVIGLNGAGKTTLLKLIAGLLKPVEGRIKVRGKVSMAFQYPNYHFSEDSVEGEVKNLDLIKVFELKNVAKRNPHSLSCGEAKRLSIAKAFNWGDIVLLDEPTVGQDYTFRRKLINITRKSDKTVVIATHDLKLASFCDGVIDLDKGVTFNC